MTLPTQTIGPFSVSATSLGCMDLSHTYGEKPAKPMPSVCSITRSTPHHSGSAPIISTYSAF
jgi:hypothetical protein